MSVSESRASLAQYFFLTLLAACSTNAQSNDDGAVDASVGLDGPSSVDLGNDGPSKHTPDLAGADLSGLNGWTDEGFPSVKVSPTLTVQVIPTKLAAHPTEARHLLMWSGSDTPSSLEPGAVEWIDGTATLAEPVSGADVFGNSLAFGAGGSAYTFYSNAATEEILVGYRHSSAAWTTASLGSVMSIPPQFGLGGYPPQGYSVSAVAPERVYAFNSGDLFDVSTPETTTTWKRYAVSTALGESVTWITPAEAGAFYASGTTMVKKCALSSSVTCGAASVGIASGDVPVRMFVSAASVATIYVTASPGGTSSFYGSKLYKSTDAGAHFSPVTIGAAATGKSIGDVMLHPSNASILAVSVITAGGPSDLYVSKDGASTFAQPPFPANVNGTEGAAMDANGTIFIVYGSIYSITP